MYQIFKPIQDFILSLDLSIYDYFSNNHQNQHVSEVLFNILYFITYLGDPRQIFFISIAICLVLILYKKSLALVHFVSIMCISGIVIYALKEIFERSRPKGFIESHGYSFPSGHSLIIAILIPFIVYTYIAYVKSGLARAIVLSGSLIIILVMGFSRIYFGVHYLSDVLGGIIIGALISAISVVIMEKFRKTRVYIDKGI